MSPSERNPGPARHRLRLFGGAFVLVAIAVVAYGMGSRATENANLQIGRAHV